jgi:hypothetical protein
MHLSNNSLPKQVISDANVGVGLRFLVGGHHSCAVLCAAVTGTDVEDEAHNRQVIKFVPF